MNWDDDVYHLLIGSKVLGNMKYLMRSLKQATEAIGSWTEEKWDVKRVNLLYNMVSGGLVFRINKSVIH